jgi:hypothetical protein
MTANYYGMISLIDHSVGRILTTLSDLGLNGTRSSSIAPTMASCSAITVCT